MYDTVECPYCEKDNTITYDDHDGQDNFDEYFKEQDEEKS